MIEYIRRKWTNYKNEKSLFGKISDVVFVLFLIALLIPSSRKEISSFAIRLTSTSPGTINPNEQKTVSKEAMQWRLISMDGEEVQLSDFNGKPVFINFWATWCPPCVAELPEIRDLYKSYHQEVAFLLITDESPETVQVFMKKNNYDFPVYFNQSSVPDIFSTGSIPATFVVDPDHKIVIEKRGAAKWNSDSMHELLDTMIHK